MNLKATLDKAGRVVLPKAVRDVLHLVPGDSFDVTAEGDIVTLRPRRTATDLQKERGVWVVRTGEALSANETNEAVRAVREQRSKI